MKRVDGRVFDEERALYGERDLLVTNCRFEGPGDGESAMKECRDVVVEDSYFALRYPFWHGRGIHIAGCGLTEDCRAPLWYSAWVELLRTQLYGVKALRECEHVRVAECDIRSPEFGWSVRHLHMENTRACGEYFLLRGEKLCLKDVTFSGKYSFQYVKDAQLCGCTLHTKDAFWHAKNVTVRDSVLTGEYLGWYSEGLTLIRCKIEGTQPLCYAKRLRLIDCEMVNTDLAFEKSAVRATICGHIDSIKNPRSGRITACSVGKIIQDEKDTRCAVVIK